MLKILLVYNTCGINRDNTEKYISSIDSILHQVYKNNIKIDLCYSGCLNRQRTKEIIKNKYKDIISFNFIEECHPVNVTFNLSVMKMIECFGRYDAYFYIDSGSIFKNNTDIQSCINHYSSEYGMITPQPSKDTEYYAGLGVGRYRGDDEYARQILFKEGNYIIPIGKGMATHVNMISDTLVSFYGKVYPDIFAGHCTESTFSFLNAALGSKWLLLKDVIIEQNVGMDGQSSGFDTMKWVMSGGKTYDHPYKIPSILNRIVTNEARLLGMGYEECNNIMIHDKNCYKDNICKNQYLKYWIRDHLFLTTNELNYDKIQCEFEASL